MARAQQRRTRRRRRLTNVAIGAAVAVGAIGIVVAVLALTQGDPDPDRARSSATTPAPTLTLEPTTTTTTTTTAPPPTITAAPGRSPIEVDRRYAVGVHDVIYVDTTRSTSPNGDFAGAPTRTLPTTIWYPAVGDPASDPQPEAAPERAHGRFPLVLFAHGYSVTPDFYRPLLERWAAAGYVVAAPAFPFLSGTPGGSSHTDYEKTFDDASFVIDRVIATATSDPVAALVDPDRIAAAGHSDGEVIAFGIGYLQCCRDARVDSVIPMAGNLANTQNPHVRDSGIPVLHIMETNDEYDPYPPSIAWDRENLTAPRYLLTLVNASHVPPYNRPGNAHFELVVATTIDFLDGTLKGHPERLDRIEPAIAASANLASLER